MGRPPCCDKSNVKRGPWTAEEDAKILACVATHGIGNWTLVPKKAGLNRCGKSCRLRWTNYLRPDLKHDNFTPQEEELIINYHKAVGSRWSLIARNLPGRTDNDVKNYWNTKLKKKLTKMGIDPLTHKPIAQTLSDFRNVTLISNTANPISPFTRNININGPSGSNVTILNPVIEQVQANSSNTHRQLPSYEIGSMPNYEILGKEVTSSCCSSSASSANLTPEYLFYQQPSQITLFSPSTWNEVLNTDHIMSFQGTFPSTELSTLAQDNLAHFNAFDGKSHLCFGDEILGSFFPGLDGGNQANNYQADASSSTAGSFVDGLLEKDREMQLEFPELIDPSFDYHEF